MYPVINSNNIKKQCSKRSHSHSCFSLPCLPPATPKGNQFQQFLMYLFRVSSCNYNQMQISIHFLPTLLYKIQSIIYIVPDLFVFTNQYIWENFLLQNIENFFFLEVLYNMFQRMDQKFLKSVPYWWTHRLFANIRY